MSKKEIFLNVIDNNWSGFDNFLKVVKSYISTLRYPSYLEMTSRMCAKYFESNHPGFNNSSLLFRIGNLVN